MQSNLTCSLGYATILQTIALTDIIELLTVTWSAIVKTKPIVTATLVLT